MPTTILHRVARGGSLADALDELSRQLQHLDVRQLILTGDRYNVEQAEYEVAVIVVVHRSWWSGRKVRP